MVENLCKDITMISWPQEIKIARQLYAKNPIKEFWENLTSPKCNCLAFFLTKKGKEIIESKIKAFGLAPPREAVEKLEENRVVNLDFLEKESKNSSKTKTVLEFLE